MRLTRRRLLTAATALPLAAALPAQAARPPSGLSFAGRSWTVRSGTGGPGPNTWDGASPYVDSAGLHLRIASTPRGWTCSEVFLAGALGFGTYEWSFTVPVLDANVVLGLFTYETDTRETDVELARWGNAADPTNAQWAVQPAGTPGNLRRLVLPPGAQVTTRYRWTSGRADFSGSVDGQPLEPWSSTAATTSSRGKVHMNLWLFEGRPPTDGRPVDVAVRSFSFTRA